MPPTCAPPLTWRADCPGATGRAEPVTPVTEPLKRLNQSDISRRHKATWDLVVRVLGCALLQSPITSVVEDRARGCGRRAH